jgi:DNA polymerase-3 subunit gamma/tau
MLGMVETELLFQIADALGRKNCALALEVLDRIIDQGKDLRQLNRDLVEHFRHLMVIKIGGKTLGKLVDSPAFIKEMLLTQSSQFSLREIVDTIEAFIESQEVARIVGALRLPLEITFAKLTHTADKKADAQPATLEKNPFPKSTVDLTDKSQDPKRFSPLGVLKNQKGEIHLSAGEPSSPSPHASNTPASNDIASRPPDTSQIPESTPDTGEPQPLNDDSSVVPILDLEAIKRTWDTVTYAISRQKMSVATYLQEGCPYAFEKSRLTIGFSKEAAFQKESLERRDILELVEKVFSDKFKQLIKIELKIIDNYKPQDDEPFIQSALETFKGKIVNKWHKESDV